MWNARSYASHELPYRASAAFDQSMHLTGVDSYSSIDSAASELRIAMKGREAMTVYHRCAKCKEQF